jgi:hypothetical protein
MEEVGVPILEALGIDCLGGDPILSATLHMRGGGLPTLRITRLVCKDGEPDDVVAGAFKTAVSRYELVLKGAHEDR